MYVWRLERAGGEGDVASVGRRWTHRGMCRLIHTAEPKIGLSPCGALGIREMARPRKLRGGSTQQCSPLWRAPWAARP
eukprot:2281911-Prymnesium_polylepis.1